MSDAARPPKKVGWLRRLQRGLARSSARLSTGLSEVLSGRRLDEATLEDLESLLISADLGVEAASQLTQALAKTRFGQQVSPEDARATLAAEIAKILEPIATPLVIDPACKPYVVLVAGVNGVGKTTTIGKMAKRYSDAGLRTSLVAGDTFRAAAVEQLRVWGQRAHCTVEARTTGTDAAGLAYDAVRASTARGDDVVLIDTAGRLHNRVELMEELRKVRRVIQKVEPTAPHATLLVVDAMTGQNAHAQVEIFKEAVAVTGLVVTKLDGSAKGGVVVALTQKFGLPIHFIGVGETTEDLRLFEAQEFADNLIGAPPHPHGATRHLAGC